MNALRIALGIGASLALAGCYLPEGTERVTGGSGQSVIACYAVDSSPGECLAPGATDAGGPVVVSAEMMLQKQDEGGFEGRFQFNDRTSKLIVSGDIAFNLSDTGVAASGAGVAFEGPVRYKFESGKFQAGYVAGGMFQVPATVPGDTRTAPLRHAMLLCLNFDSTPGGLESGCDREYYAIFEGGNYVFHGARGVIAR